RAEQFVAAAKTGYATSAADRIFGDPKIDAVVICTLNAALAPLALAAIRAGKHVLVEKPGAISVAEVDELLSATRSAGVRVRVGFNHRYHPALLRAHELFASGALGP